MDGDSAKRDMLNLVEHAKARATLELAKHRLADQPPADSAIVAAMVGLANFISQLAYDAYRDLA